MSARIIALVLVAGLAPGLAYAKKAERKLVNQDRELYAQPYRATAPSPSGAQPPARPTLVNERSGDDANGS